MVVAPKILRLLVIVTLSNRSMEMADMKNGALGLTPRGMGWV